MNDDSYQHAKAISSTLWNIGDEVLRNRIEKKEWDRILLPFIVLRRLDCLLVKEYEKKKGGDLKTIKKSMVDMNRHYANSWWNKDHMADGGPLAWIVKNTKDIHRDLTDYVKSFNKDVVSVFEALELLPSESVTSGTISRLNAKLGENLLKTFLTKLVEGVDFGEASGNTMGNVFEDCIRRFNEEKKTDAGEHYTPRDAIELLTRVLLNGDYPNKGESIDFYDPTCGTGGILLEGEKCLEERCKEKGISVKINLYGQELMSFTHGICQADLLLRGYDFKLIKHGDTLVEDKHGESKKFRYQGANPPYGVKWKSIEKEVRAEVAKGERGRFPSGFAPKTVQEGQLLFLQHMVYKMNPVSQGGGRIAIVMNGNPLFAADAGEGDSEIRGWLLQKDLVEAIIALPKEMFFNTGIATYIWVLNNNKAGKGHAKKRIGHVQLIDASGMGTRLSKSLGNKRYQLSKETIKEIAKWHEKVAGEETDARCKVLPIEHFGYWSVDIEETVPGEKKPKKDTERIPLLDCPSENFESMKEIIRTMRPEDAGDFEVKSATKGWEIPFTQIFYKYEAPEDPLILGKKVQEVLAGIKIDLSFLGK